MAFFRKLSPAEVTYLARDTKEASPFVNQFIVEGDGAISEIALREAVSHASEANPGVKIRLRSFFGWRYWDDNGFEPLIEYKKSRWDGQSSAGMEGLNAPMNTRSDPLLHIVVLENSEINSERIKIIFRIHHSVCDGMGTLHFIQEVFRALRGETLVGSNGIFSELDIVNQEEYPKETPERGNCLPVTPKANDPSVRGCDWLKFRWQGKETKILPKLIYTISQICIEEHGEGKLLYRIPSDLRRYLKGVQKDKVHLTNLSGAIDLPVSAEDDVNSIHRKIISAMRAKQDLSVYPPQLKYATWAPNFIYKANEAAISEMNKNGVCSLTGMISHLGKIDFLDYSFEDFHAAGLYAIPMPLDDRSIYIGLTVDSYGGNQNINAVISIPNALANLEDIQRLQKEICQRLNQL